jgi:hypothetical protein
MKNLSVESAPIAGSEIIAFFGNALLVRWPDGTYQIQGGSGEDRKRAAEWAARFVDVRFGRIEIIEGTVTCRLKPFS